MPKYKIEKEFIFSKKGQKELNLFLDQYEGLLNLSDVKDQKGNTAIHQCAFFDQPKLLQKYITFMESYLTKTGHPNPIKAMDQFLNMQNLDGLTALHYAAFKGHFKILEILQKNGADINILTKKGQNALHMAAQGDKVETFIYFQYSLDMNCRDKKQTTPLHWAAFGSSQAVVTYLLAQNHLEIDCRDEKNQTPLHFAAAYGNTKIVKKLLKAGANRTYKNSQNQTALDIAKQNEFRNIVKLLDDNYTILDKIKLCLNLKTDYRLQKKSHSKPLFFIAMLFLYCSIRFALFKTLGYYSIIEIVLYALVLILYLSLAFISAPKPIPKSYTYYLNNNINIPLKYVCLICIQEKSHRSSHCDICKTCVARYDHHCYWINNCVGQYNHNRFLGFIILFLIYLIYLGTIGGFLIFKIKDKSFDDILHFQFSLSVNKIIVFGYAIMTVGLCLMLIVPMILLVGVQIKNVFMNKTTYERFTKDKISTFTQSTSHIIEEQIEISLKKKKKKKWSLLNAREMLCSEGDQETTIRQINNSSLTQSLTQ